jgi:hypothetical protein
LSRDDEEQDKLSRKKNTKREIGEDDMAVMDKELQDVQKLRQNVNRAQLRKALIKETIKENHKALQRLSRT